jgi:hypothetical protein
VRSDSPGDPDGSGQPGDDGGGIVALHAVAPPVEQQWPVDPSVQRLIDGLVRARVQRDLGGLVALADDSQRRLVAGAAEIVDIGAARLGDRSPFNPSRQTSGYV